MHVANSTSELSMLRGRAWAVPRPLALPLDIEVVHAAVDKVSLRQVNLVPLEADLATCVSNLLLLMDVLPFAKGILGMTAPPWPRRPLTHRSPP